MFKFLKNKKFIKIISFLLIFAFSINLVGCDHQNDVTGGQAGGGKKHYSVGVGNDVTGYGVYAQSTFDKMTKELFMGYLLSSRSFSLVIVPGEENPDNEEEPYKIINPDNVLFNSAYSGVYDYNEITGEYDNHEYKALLYYVTNLEFVSWLNDFEEGTGFLGDALEFASKDVNLEKPDRYKCSILVNLGSGLNAIDFCGTYSGSMDSLTGGIITNDKYVKYKTGEYKVFDNDYTGGMVLLFGQGSIEGYMTYQHIMEYQGSEVANSFDAGDCYYTPGLVGQFDYPTLIAAVKSDLINGGYYTNDDFANYQTNDTLKSDIVSTYTEKMLLGKKGCTRLKETYKLLEQSLLTDNNATSLGALSNTAYNKKNSTTGAEQDKWSAIYEMTRTINSFYDTKLKEQFNIKFSASLHTRYSSFKTISNTEVLSSGRKVTSLENVTFDRVMDLVKTNQATEDDYVILVTAQGFIHDRGTEEDQVVLGASEMMGYAGIMQELIRMDACPNATIAAEMFNMLANLKIVAGTALAVAGVTAMAVAYIGLTVASVISKLAMVSSVTPVPGGRIAALVLIGIAGLVALVAGAITLYSGLKDKARLKGMGASEENYCKTYAATFNMLFETITLTVPVYHYDIAKDNDGDDDDAISINYCDQGTYNATDRMCNVYENNVLVSSSSAVSIPMYYYADREQSEQLNLQGMPAMLHFKDGKLIDSVYGATTPAFIVEALRFWGLLAMREMVYIAESNGSKVTIKHTTNTNAKTMKIMEVKYCYTLEYELNVYEVATTDFCYYDGNYAKVVNPNYTDWKGDTNAAVTEIDITNKDGVIQRLKDIYGSNAILGYFSDLAVYQYNVIKTKLFASVVNNPTSVKLDRITGAELNNYSSANISYTISGVTNYVSGTALVKNDFIFVVSGNDVHLFEKMGNAYVYYGVVATFNEGYNLYSLESELTTCKIDAFDFFNYVVGSPIESQTVAVNVKLYLTATIKESPQSNYYYDGGTKKYCDAGEYLYYRDNLIWSDNPNKCLSDAKAKSKDSPRSTVDVGGDVEYNYYSTSVAVADLSIGIDADGNTKVGYDWLKDGSNEVIWFE